MSGNGIVTLLFLWAAWAVVKRVRKVLLERRAGASPDVKLPRFADDPADQSVPSPEPGFQEARTEREVRPDHRQPPVPAAPACRRLTRRQQLRRAVVWAEILAPPVGLRRE